MKLADMRHEWMYRARRVIKNGADSMQYGKDAEEKYHDT